MLPTWIQAGILCLSITLAIFYWLLMRNYVKGWRQLALLSVPQEWQGSTRIDVVVPARNEEENIELCVHSILENDYPSSLVEVYIVDDHSDDQTSSIVQKLSRQYSNLNLIRMQDLAGEKEQNSFKKAALHKGILAGKGELILCTDADCILPANWLAAMANFYERNEVQFIAGPVLFHEEKNTLGRFQSLDFIGMMLITGAGIQQTWMHMSNGANLGYTRSAFQAVNGFQGIDHLASGDDMLLMQKIAKAYPGQIGYLKSRSAVVKTKPQKTYQDFISQRIRWASKSAYYPEWKVTAALAGVFFFCWAILLSLFLIPLKPPFFIGLFVVLVLFKSSVDYWMLREACLFFKREDLLRSFIPSQIHHICYICCVGLLANVRKTYSWKGRRVH